MHETVDRRGIDAQSARIATSASRTDTAGSLRVVGRFISRNDPSDPVQTMSVNVPPISTPTL